MALLLTPIGISYIPKLSQPRRYRKLCRSIVLGERIHDCVGGSGPVRLAQSLGKYPNRSRCGTVVHGLPRIGNRPCIPPLELLLGSATGLRTLKQLRDALRIKPYLPRNRTEADGIDPGGNRVKHDTQGREVRARGQDERNLTPRLAAVGFVGLHFYYTHHRRPCAAPLQEGAEAHFTVGAGAVAEITSPGRQDQQPR